MYQNNKIQECCYFLYIQFLKEHLFRDFANYVTLGDSSSPYGVIWLRGWDAMEDIKGKKKSVMLNNLFLIERTQDVRPL